MKSISLLLLRFSTGFYLVLWGALKFLKPEAAIGVSDKYYAGLISSDILNYGIGALEVVVGLAVILGVFRAVAYPAQALIYLVGLLAITPNILDPFGLYLASEPKLTFFPSTTLFFATLVLIAFKSDDTKVLERSV